MISSLNNINSIHPPEMGDKSSKEGVAAHVVGVKIYLKQKTNSYTHNPLTLWNVFVNVQLHILCDPRVFR